MADHDLRRAARAWRANDGDATLPSLVTAHARAGRDLPLDALRRAPRWRRLTDFIDAWFEEPLGERDGVSLDAIAAIEARPGDPFPAALREWHRLAGLRVRSVRYRPVCLEDVRVVPGELMIYGDLDRSPTVGVTLDHLGDEDPPVTIVARQQRAVGPPLSELLFTISLRELLWGCGARRGSFGRVRASFRAGWQVEARTAMRRARRSFAPLVERALGRELDLSIDELVGDDDTIIRLSDSDGITWATRTVEAHQRLVAGLGLTERADSIVHLIFDRLPPAAGKELFALARDPDTLLALSTSPLGGGPMLRPTVRRASWACERVEVTLGASTEWRAAFERALSRFAPWRSHLMAARRPVSSGVYAALWPADLDVDLFWPSEDEG
jgi:hypothetical protein